MAKELPELNLGELGEKSLTVKVTITPDQAIVIICDHLRAKGVNVEPRDIHPDIHYAHDDSTFEGFTFNLPLTLTLPAVKRPHDPTAGKT